MQPRVFVRTARTVLGVVVFAFSAIGALITPAALLVVWILLGFAIGAAVWRGMVSLPVLGAREPDAWTGVVVAASVVVMCLAVTGMIALVGLVATACLVVLVAAAAVWAGRSSGVRSDSARELDVPAGPVSTVVREPVVPAHTLSIDELCLAWRRSYLQLQRATDEHARQQVIRTRQAYLDELEQRDRSGFARWLQDGARAGSDPRRYLSSD